MGKQKYSLLDSHRDFAKELKWRRHLSVFSVLLKTHKHGIAMLVVMIMISLLCFVVGIFFFFYQGKFYGCREDPSDETNSICDKKWRDQYNGDPLSIGITFAGVIVALFVFVYPYFIAASKGPIEEGIELSCLVDILCPEERFLEKQKIKKMMSDLFGLKYHPLEYHADKKLHSIIEKRLFFKKLNSDLVLCTWIALKRRDYPLLSCMAMLFFFTSLVLIVPAIIEGSWVIAPAIFLAVMAHFSTLFISFTLFAVLILFAHFMFFWVIIFYFVLFVSHFVAMFCHSILKINKNYYKTELVKIDLSLQDQQFAYKVIKLLL